MHARLPKQSTKLLAGTYGSLYVAKKALIDSNSFADVFEDTLPTPLRFVPRRMFLKYISTLQHSRITAPVVTQESDQQWGTTDPVPNATKVTCHLRTEL
eukprot:9045501-Pyramimonas_sp.AAC.2